MIIRLAGLVTLYPQWWSEHVKCRCKEMFVVKMTKKGKERQINFNVHSKLITCIGSGSRVGKSSLKVTGPPLS